MRCAVLQQTRSNRTVQATSYQQRLLSSNIIECHCRDKFSIKSNLLQELLNSFNSMIADYLQTGRQADRQSVTQTRRLIDCSHNASTGYFLSCRMNFTALSRGEKYVQRILSFVFCCTVLYSTLLNCTVQYCIEALPVKSLCRAVPLYYTTRHEIASQGVTSRMLRIKDVPLFCMTLNNTVNNC